MFNSASASAAAVIEMQRALAAHDWGEAGRVRVRMGVHSGEASETSTGLVGFDVHRAARVAALAYGGQILVSETSAALLRDSLPEGASLRDLGLHRLKDLARPQQIFQLQAAGLDLDFPPLRSLDNRSLAHNLPTPTSAFIGRKQEVKDVVALIRRSGVRLMTLTGPGGVGKTRLALAVAQAMQRRFRDGVWWIELAGVSRPEDVGATIAAALTVAMTPGEDVRDALRRHLGSKQLLLVIDNFEHVLEAAVLVAEQLAASPRLRVLVTSRERLDLAGEHRVVVGPMEVPRPHRATVKEVESADASALFLAAARRHDQNLAVTGENAGVIAQICVRLEGLPLALELAAARAAALGLPEISARLDQAIGDLGSGPRDLPARQRTLRATIDWSFRLLDADQSRAFVRFAIFAGGATLNAAGAVTGATDETLEALIAKSLVTRRLQPDGTNRLVMLESIRQYALELLGQEDERDRLRRRHAEWFLALAKHTEDRMRSSEQPVWLARLDAETDNLRAALEWSLDHDIPRGVELASTLFEPWAMHGRSHELIVWFERVLAGAAEIDLATRARALKTYGESLDIAERHEHARQVFQESLTLFRELGDRKSEADVLAEIALAAFQAGWDQETIGSDQEAISFGEAALAISRELQHAPGIQRALQIMGTCRRDDPTQAAAMLEQARAIAHERGDRHQADSITHSLGDLALDRDDWEQAANRYRDALETATDLADERLEAYCVAGLACVAAARGEILAAGRLWASAEAMEDRLARRMEPTSRKRYERILIPISEHEQFRAGQKAGGELSLDETVQLALR